MTISSFNKSLFWDASQIDDKKNRKFIMERVLNFGDEGDFWEAVKRYGKRSMAGVVLESRNLDKKSRAFLVSVFQA